MSYVIAITGKGGVGKTTVAAILINRLVARGCRPILAIDADPNTNLDTTLGVNVEKTIGGVREETREFAKQGMAEGIDKQRLLELKIAESLVEGPDFDLIAMGRPEGPGCYCYANNILKEAITRMAAHYPYVVLDNEAGLENLSRRIVQRVNLMVMVTDPSARGMDTVRRLHALAREMGIDYNHLAIVVNRLRRGKMSDHAEKLVTYTGARFAVALPDNEEITDWAETGRSLMPLGTENPVVSTMDAFISDVGLYKTSR